MKIKHIRLALIICILLSVCVGCEINVIPMTTPIPEKTQTSSEPTLLSTEPQAEISFEVQVPGDTSEDDRVYLSIMDEVTGLALNAQNIPMEFVDAQHYVYKMSFPLGSVIKYRYLRQGEEIFAQEHISDGRPVRYLIFYVTAPATVQDVVSRWTDTEFHGATGRIMGEVTDQNSNQPLAGLLVTAGGAQTLTTSDGSFLLEGLPPGTHNLVVYSLDGAYRTFQQGATVAADSTTPTPIQVSAAPMTKLVFVVSMPENTIPAVPIRMAGNLLQFGNTFADLSGGISTLASRMPTLTMLPDKRYSITISLPAGADIRYLYTMGDGIWNTELTAEGKPNIRQLIVPEESKIIEESVKTWNSSNASPITFDLTVPENTPAEDFISIQFRLVYGWTEPIPMWRLGPNRWAYILNSPQHIIGDISYRYCRNNQCGSADDAQTMGSLTLGFPVKLSNTPQTITDNIPNWAWIGSTGDSVSVNTTDIKSRGNFIAGIEFSAYYHPSWTPLLTTTLKDMSTIHNNWIILDPSWSSTRNNPAVFETVTGQDPLWIDTVNEISEIRNQNLNVALFPVIKTDMEWADWWTEAERSYFWWQVWFEHYQDFIINYADMASRANAQAIILGGDWLEPALPKGTLSDGTPSGVPEDAEIRWRNLIEQVRLHYNGPIFWALSYDQAVKNPPPFLDKVDALYLLWSVRLSDNTNATVGELQTEIVRLIDNGLLPLQAVFRKPLVIGLAYPSVDGAVKGCAPASDGGCYDFNALSRPNLDIPEISLDLQEQVDIYNAMLNAINQRAWISGIVSRGYYPPAKLQDKSNSIHGKPVEELLANWFPILLFSPAQ
ncbi:MAG: carboxypeptidase regulatory-like domain-containing protein [Chloroflexi bacterium]|nr:carboxypeptidase regulatory-like domain-containing protein [Chloroflexota bacterium]